MDFEELIETLSKGSATAVTTLESNVAELNVLKEYLYVQTPVEAALRAEIDSNLNKPRVIFVCGSSGDGKSELFRRIYASYGTKVRFHLDATHSFDPQKDAIQTLDDQFSEFKAGKQTRVVGINIGMLGNYAADGNHTHADIKTAISKYLEGDNTEASVCSFVDFRNYPKFKITTQHVDAQFIGQLLERLVDPKPGNPFFVASQRANLESQLARNFYLLQIPEVREKLLDVLLHAHLRYDQFLTARTVLDFVYRILTGEGFLFDNIFRLSGSDLLDALQKLDPCTKRSKRLDLFRIRTKLEIFDPEFLAFRDKAVDFLGTKSLEPSSWIRFTVTKESGLYTEILEHGTASSIGEFNAFNGEWLLKMVTAQKNTRTEREGILGAWKLISCLLSGSDIVWVPLSVAELIRVSGNIGLKMSESDFSRHHKNSEFKGVISDDIVFAGFKSGKLYLLPVEVKTGSTPDIAKAVTQARKLSEFLKDGLLSPRTLEGQLYRSLFVTQVLMQIEKYELYEVFEKEYFVPIKRSRQEWLAGEYEVAEIEDYPTGFAVSNLNSVTAFQTRFNDEDGIAKFEIPIGFLKTLVGTPRTELQTRLAKDNFLHVPDRYFLGRTVSTPESVTLPDEPETAKAWLAVTVAEPPVTAAAADSVVSALMAKEPIRIQFGTDIQTDARIYWEPTNTQKVLNPNTAIIGTMGTGKTQFTKSVITQLVRQQDRNVAGAPIGVLILDYKSDYTKNDFVKATNATVLKLHRLPFNPLALFGNRPMLPMHTANLFRSTLATAFNLGNKQQNRLRNLVMDAYKESGITPDDSATWKNMPPTLWDVWKLYLDQDKVEEDSLYAALDDLISFEIFETDPSKVQSLYDLVNGVVVLDLSGYDPTIQNLVVAITLDIFYTQMHQQGSSKLDGAHRQLSKLVLVDEADNFMRQDFTSLRVLLKEGREFGVGTILSTQELTHFKTAQNDYSGYILSWIIHRVAKIGGQDVKAIFNAESKQEVDRLMAEKAHRPNDLL